MRTTHDPDPPPNSPAIPLPTSFLRLKFRCRPAGQNFIKILIHMIFSMMRGAFQGRGQKFPLPSGTTPGAFDPGDPGLECGAQLGEAVVLGNGTLDDGVADHRSTRRDRDREGVAGPAWLRRLAAFGRRELGEERLCGLEVALDVALQKARDDLAVAAAARLRPPLEKACRVLVNAEESRHSRTAQRVGRIDPTVLVPSLDRKAATRSADELAVASPAAVAKRAEHGVDNLLVGHRIGEEGRRRLLVDPLAAGGIAECHPCPIDAARVGRLNNLPHSCTRRIDAAWPVMIADRLAVPVDLAVIDMSQVDRRFGRCPFAREARRHGGLRPERDRRQNQQGKKCQPLHARSGSATAADHGDITSEMPWLTSSSPRSTRFGQAKRAGKTVCSTRLASGCVDSRSMMAGASLRSMPIRPLLTSTRGWCAAACGAMPKSTTKLAICNTAPRIRLPPDAPVPNHGRASRATTSGHILVSARLPGMIELGRPGSGSNHITPLFNRTPVPGRT